VIRGRWLTLVELFGLTSGILGRAALRRRAVQPRRSHDRGPATATGTTGDTQGRRLDHRTAQREVSALTKWIRAVTADLPALRSFTPA